MEDEAAKRRERRKQKILGNAQGRLTRILTKEEAVLPEASGQNEIRKAPTLDFGNRVENAKPQPPSHQTPYNPIASMDFSEIPPEAIRNLWGANQGSLTAENEALANQMQQILSQMMQNPDASPMEMLAQIASSLETNDQFSSPSARVPSKRSKHQFFRDPHNVLRIVFILILSVLTRIFLPFLPHDYALMFAPLYLLELFSLSLCVLRSNPPSNSTMAPIFSLMSLFGIRRPLVKAGETISGTLELIMKDIWTYSFGFFMMHVLCQQAGFSAVADGD